MRQSAIALAAALLLGTTAMAVAAPHGPGGVSGGGGGAPHASFGGGGGPHANFSAGAPSAMHGNFAAAPNRGNFAAAPKNFAAAPNRGNFAAAPNRSNFAANNFSGRGWHGRDHDRRFRRGFGFGGLYAFGGADYYGDYGCWQRRLVPTRFGLRWRLVDVCAY